MGKERRVFTADFKRNAVELAQGSERPTAQIARELGILPGALYRWLDEAREESDGSRKAFVGQGNPRDEELTRLRREVADLRETNEILKKATAIFAQARLR